MYPLTRRELADERAAEASEDARERLQNIRDARNEALAAIKAAVDKLIEVADAQRKHGSTPEKDRRDGLEAIDEQLGEIIHGAVSGLEDYEIGEGIYDTDSARDDAAEAEWDRRKEEGFV